MSHDQEQNPHGIGASPADGDVDRIVIAIDGEEDVTCDVLGVFEASGREYVALLPVAGDEVMIFRYSESAAGTELGDIEDEQEYEDVAEVFYDLFLDETDLDDEDL